MGIQAIERAIMDELREVTGDSSLKLKQLQEWSSGKIAPQEGEVLYYLPKLGLNAVILPAPPKKRPARKEG